MIDFIENFLPSSPVFYLIYLGGVIVFSVLMIFWLAKKQKKKKKNSVKKELSIDDLIRIASNPKSTQADLLSALMLYNDKFNVSDDKDKALKFFQKILNHKNRNKVHFDYFHGKVLPKNLKYKNELDELEKKALNN